MTRKNLMSRKNLPALVFIALLSLTACETSQTVSSPSIGVQTTDYLITFRNFDMRDRLAILDAMENKFAGRPVIGNWEGSTRTGTLNYRSSLTTTQLNSALYETLMAMGFADHEVRISVRDGRKLEIYRLETGRR